MSSGEQVKRRRKRERSGREALVFVLFLLLPGGAASQEVKFASSPNPVGSGGRAVGWAGAFIAVADDATAASWNPAGLVQLLLPETSIVLSYHTRNEEVEFSGFGAGSESRSRSAAQINYVSVVYPFHVGNVNMVASLNYQRLYEFDRDLEYHAASLLYAGTQTERTQWWQIQQSGALTTVTPALSVQILPQWSLGVALNIWGLDPMGRGWEQQWQSIYTDTNPSFPGFITAHNWSTTRQTYELSGVNYVLGTHYKFQNLTVGLVYKTSWEARVKFTSEFEQAGFDYRLGVGSATRIKEENTEKIIWPESYGLGVAWRWSDRLSFALDLYTTRWSQFKMKQPGKDINLLAGSYQTANIADTWQVRGGAEYLWILPKYVFALRGGFFYDPEPLEDHVNEFYGVSVGTGLVYKNWVLDAALQYRFGRDIKSERIENVLSDTEVEEFFALVSLIYHFPGEIR